MIELQPALREHRLQRVAVVDRRASDNPAGRAELVERTSPLGRAKVVAHASASIARRATADSNRASRIACSTVFRTGSAPVTAE